MAITKEQILAVADQLDAAGQKPTLTAIRKRLGSGSYTTISEAMSEWRNRKMALAAAPREAPPAAITEHLSEFGHDVWTAALALAHGRFDAERAGFHQERQQAQGEAQEARDLADQLQSEVDGLLSKAKSLEDAERRTREEGARALRSQNDATERANTTEARNNELTKRITDLNRELGRLNDQNAKLVKALAGATKLRTGPQLESSL